MKLEITKDRVLAAAEKCSTAKQTLELLFPEAFEDGKYFKFNVDKPDIVSGGFPCDFLPAYLQIRTNGEYKGKGFFLHPVLDWKIVEDGSGQLVLIPTKR